MIRPAVVTGYISPYPTVVKDMVAQYIASKNVVNESLSTLKIDKRGYENIAYSEGTNS